MSIPGHIQTSLQLIVYRFLLYININVPIPRPLQQRDIRQELPYQRVNAEDLNDNDPISLDLLLNSKVLHQFPLSNGKLILSGDSWDALKGVGHNNPLPNLVRTVTSQGISQRIRSVVSALKIPEGEREDYHGPNNEGVPDRYQFKCPITREDLDVVAGQPYTIQVPVGSTEDEEGNDITREITIIPYHRHNNHLIPTVNDDAQKLKRYIVEKTIDYERSRLC